MSQTAHALILAPRGRDAAVAAGLLTTSGIEGRSVPDLRALVAGLSDDTSMALVTQEELATADLTDFDRWLRAQPAWSDLPIVILTHAGGGPERNPHAARLLELLGNVTFLERPFHPTTFASIVKAAVGARKRQYEARARLAELAESRERLDTALLAGNLGTWELDLLTMQLETSATTRSAFGRAGDAVFGYSELLASIHPEDREPVLAALEHTGQSGADYRVECRIVWPDGSQHWAEMHGRRLLDAEGRPSKIVGVTSDITVRKTSEQQLVAVNQSLEQRVAARTAALEEAHARAIREIEQREKTEEQLVQSQKVEAIGQLTGGVAHDFNNLLMAILGNLEVLRRHVGNDERAVRLIDSALEGARRGSSLTQRLLAFARRQELEVKRHDLVALISDLTPLMRQSVGAGIEVVVNPSPSPAPAEVDVNQIELALLNLVVNARDAMPEGGTITIEVGEAALGSEPPDLAPGSYVEIVVTDTGKGMDAQTLRRAVEPFFSTKGVGKGTGLGLSMIHGLVLQLGGALQLTSAPGEGTCARILLPCAADDNMAEAATMRDTAPTAAPAAQSRILVVDDDPLIAMSTVAMVEDLGHTAIEASSGARALEIIGSDEPIDLLLTDFSMPRMSGVELIQAARALRPHLPVILATGYAELPDDARLDVARLGKPYDERQLADQINLALSRAA
ncbi:hybrid sensor histidine kinase/response regulator [Devosia nitrariae]|uniref:histidine kinase n=1 Tax=Devosia nitrariae TaxID=2071872 RepID=A0ABQ5W174_9HYPH|nr:hybrid sensor histidine kinase/response regulator [Devosia nitrariae]GLQ53795.1 hybrid sensor histidine kinase/response regulator [Devosia nitrariae]